MVMNIARDIITGFGGDWFVPMAFRIMPSTMAKRKKAVVEIRKNGAKLIVDMAIKSPIDEEKEIGSVKDCKLIFKAPGPGTA